jgi:hypothetical protein
MSPNSLPLPCPDTGPGAGLAPECVNGGEALQPSVSLDTASLTHTLNTVVTDCWWQMWPGAIFI